MCWIMKYYLIVITFAPLITLTSCETFVNAIEGESVQLRFPYPCDSLNVTLQYGSRLPFYSSSDPDNVVLNPDQSKRFKVENTTGDNGCVLLLDINLVKRLDGGIYSLYAYSTHDHVTRVSLYVGFLPGVAHCRAGGSHDLLHDWSRLHCEAEVGSMLGQIECFQGGIRMPFLIAPLEDDTTLKQTILVQHNRQRVYCCSSQLIQPKDRCDCKDFVWDPLSENQIDSQGDPCPTSTQTVIKTLTSLTTFPNQRKCETELTEDIQDNAASLETIATVIPYPLLIVFVVLFVAGMLSFLAFVIWLTRAKNLSRRGIQGSIHKGTIPKEEILAHLLSRDDEHVEISRDSPTMKERPCIGTDFLGEGC